MANLASLSTRDAKGALRAVVETPRGLSVKLTYNEELEAFELSRPLALGIVYPYDWGFFPSTRAPDGDPLDVMMVHDAATYPGVVIACKPLGVVRLSQKSKTGGRERNDRIIAVPRNAPRFDDACGLSPRVQKELQQFFVAAVFLAGKEVLVEGWDGAEQAEEVIVAAEKRHAELQRPDANNTTE